MGIDAERLFPAHLRDTLRCANLHKIAGAMIGVDEVTLKEAATVIGARAYLRRRETQKIAAAIDALANLDGIKTAASPGGEVARALLRAGLPAAAGGAGIAMLPQVLSREPTDTSHLITSGLLGGGLGLLGGAGGAGLRAVGANPESAASVAQAVRGAM